MTAEGKFTRALRLLLGHEGTLSDHAADRGGRTNFGITQATYDDWRRRQKKATRPVDEIGATEVRAIYKADYWDAVRGDDLPWHLAYPSFDAAVNSGPVRARQWLQKGLGVTVDGDIGPITLGAAEASSRDAAVAVVRARGDFIVDLVRRDPTQMVFLRGWIRRLLDVAGEASR